MLVVYTHGNTYSSYMYIVHIYVQVDIADTSPPQSACVYFVCYVTIMYLQAKPIEYIVYLINS